MVHQLDPTPRGQGGTAAPSAPAQPGTRTPTAPSLRQVAFSQKIATVTRPDGIVLPRVTVDAGWLPPRASVQSDYHSARGGVGSGRQWSVPYHDGRPGGYFVSVAQPVRRLLPPNGFNGTTGRDLTIRGHPARMFDVHFGAEAHQLTVFVDFGAGKIYSAQTYSHVGRLKPATAVRVTLHIAQTVTVNQHDALPATARLSVAPPGVRIVAATAIFDDAVYRDHFTMTAYRLDDLDAGAVIAIGGMPGDYSLPNKGAPGRQVQGKPSVVIRSRDQTTLYIKGLFGRLTRLISGKGAPRIQDLYRIADGIRVIR